MDEDDGERVGRCELAGIVIETLDLAFLGRRSLGHDGQGSRLDRRRERKATEATLKMEVRVNFMAMSGVDGKRAR